MNFLLQGPQRPTTYPSYVLANDVGSYSVFALEGSRIRTYGNLALEIETFLGSSRGTRAAEKGHKKVPGKPVACVLWAILAHLCATLGYGGLLFCASWLSRYMFVTC